MTEESLRKKINEIISDATPTGTRQHASHPLLSAIVGGSVILSGNVYIGCSIQLEEPLKVQQNERPQ